MWSLVKTNIEHLRSVAAEVLAEAFQTEADGARSLTSFTSTHSPFAARFQP